MKRLFLFDLDGTLVNTSGAGTRSLKRAFQELYGIDDVLKSIQVHGKTDPAIFRETVRVCLDRDIQPGEADKFFDRYLSILETEVRAPGSKGLLAGVESFVKDLSRRADAVLALGTGNLERGARLKLEPHGLNEFFPVGGYGSDAEERAEVLRFGHRRGMERAGEAIAPEQVFVIGDTPHDVTAARKAGFRVMTVASGSFSMDALRALSPDYALPDMTHAPAWLASLA